MLPACSQFLHSIEGSGSRNLFGSGVSVTQASSARILSMLDVRLNRDVVSASVSSVMDKRSFNFLRGEYEHSRFVQSQPLLQFGRRLTQQSKGRPSDSVTRPSCFDCDNPLQRQSIEGAVHIRDDISGQSRGSTILRP